MEIRKQSYIFFYPHFLLAFSLLLFHFQNNIFKDKTCFALLLDIHTQILQDSGRIQAQSWKQIQWECHLCQWTKHNVLSRVYFTNTNNYNNTHLLILPKTWMSSWKHKCLTLTTSQFLRKPVTTPCTTPSRAHCKEMLSTDFLNQAVSKTDT